MLAVANVGHERCGYSNTHQVGLHIHSLSLENKTYTHTPGETSAAKSFTKNEIYKCQCITGSLIRHY